MYVEAEPQRKEQVLSKHNCHDLNTYDDPRKSNLSQSDFTSLTAP